MPTETFIVTIKVNFVRVYFTEIPALFKARFLTCKIPPGLIPGDYEDLHIEIERKGGE